MRGTFIASMTAAGLSIFSPAFAQSDPPRVAPAPAPDWTLTIGVEGRMLPSFEGSSRYIFSPAPVFDIRRAGTPRRFSAPRDGVSAALVNIGQFRLGPTGKLLLPRNEDDDDALRGLGDVDWTLELGLFAEYWWQPWLRTRAEVRQGIGGHHGLVAELTADFVIPATERLTLSAGPRLTLATSAALRPYFGVDAVQSINSGLPVYDPSGGVRSYGVGAQARYQWTQQWATNLFVEYDRLVGDAANSPIVARSGSANQVTVGVGISYTFDIHLGIDLP